MAFPDDPLAIGVYLYYSGAWRDISEYVYARNEITIRRSRDATGNPETVNLTLLLDNRDGRFSVRNPESPLYELIGRNTLIWVTAGGGWRFVGKVVSWPVEWGDGGADVWVPITAAGPLRQLQIGGGVLKSPLRRLCEASTTAVAYWPMEETSGATEFGSLIEGVPPMRNTTGSGEVKAAENSDLVGSDALPVCYTARMRGRVPRYTPATAGGQVRFVMQVPETGIVDTGVLADIAIVGTYDHVRLRYDTDDSGSLYLDVVDDKTYGYSIVTTTGNYAFGVNGKNMLVAVDLWDDGANVDYAISVYTEGDTVSYEGSGTFAGHRITRVKSVTLNPYLTSPDVVFGHLLVDSTQTAMSGLLSSVNGFAGDDPDSRLDRLCAENGLDYDGGDPSEALMGPQRSRKLIDLINECDRLTGIVFETRDSAFSISYRTNYDLYNQTPALTLDYSADGPVSMFPVDDDSLMANDVVVYRATGGLARSVRTDGTLGSDAVGVYDTSVNLSLWKEGQCADHASWLTYLGTRPDERYPRITIDMARLASVAPLVYADVMDVDIGDLIRVESLPAWLPGDATDLVVIGYEERFLQFSWVIDFQCLPASRFSVFQISAGEEFSRCESSAAQLNTAVNTTDTTFIVDTLAGAEPFIDSTAYAAMYPIALMCEGEELSATACTDTTSPQSFTVTRSVNGVVKSHNIGAVVTLKASAVLGI